MRTVPNTIEQVEALGGYSIVYADPNWKYRNNGRGAAVNHYETAPDTDLARLPVSRVAAKNAVLFMWATWPTLPVGLATMKAWDFEYKALGFLWVKHYNEKNVEPFWGGGFWTRSNSEICLLGVRGDLRRLDAKDARSVHQLVETWGEQDDLVLRAPVRGHSAKPSEVRDRIFRLMGNLPAIELFARCVDGEGKVIPGGRVADQWDQWGDECDSDVIMTLDTNRQNSSTANANEVAKADAKREANEVAEANANESEKETTMAFLPKGFGYETAQAEATISRERLKDGEYVFMHKAMFLKNTQSGDAIIIEHKIVEAKPLVPGVEPTPVGSSWGHFLPKYGKAAVMLKPNLKAYVLGLLGLADKKGDDAFNRQIGDTIDAMGDERQAARGMLIRGRTFHTKTEEGEDFMGVNWSAYPGENVIGSPSVLKRRAELDAEKPSDAGATSAPPSQNGAQAPAPPIPGAGAPPVPGADPFAGWNAYPPGSPLAQDGSPWRWRATDKKVASEKQILAGAI